MSSLKIFELYSGIGGMHFAFKDTGINGRVVRAIDINPMANSVYKINFPDVKLLEKNIQGLTEADFDKNDIDLIMMSPPCQPFTRNGLRKDLLDKRNCSVMHVISMIPKLKTVKFILLENVQGFETSHVRNELVNSLEKSNFLFQEFLLSPDQFSIPNSRLRYYLLAKRKPLQFCFDIENKLLLQLPKLPPNVNCQVKKMNAKYRDLAGENKCFQVGAVLREKTGDSVSDDVLMKYGTLLDVVTQESRRTCCFTKSYSRYVEGTGSVFTPKPQEELSGIYENMKKYDKSSEEYLKLLSELKLRYFSPEEVASLMAFPEQFKFPEHLVDIQKYRLLGNSINVHVVSILTAILLS